MLHLEAETLKLSVAVRHAEDWSAEYAKDPKTHLMLLKSEARMRIDLTKYFGGIAAQISRYINWIAYRHEVTQKLAVQQPNYQVQVIVQDVPVEQYDGTFIKVSFDDLATMTAVGALAGEDIYDIPLGIQSTDEVIQQLTTEHVAKLVGKKVLPDGSIVDNENKEGIYKISDKTRNDIAQSIKTSLNLGETVQDATQRLQNTIANPTRAKIIAQTESVNAYQGGLMEFGTQSGAVAKQWQDAGAVDVCATNTADGPILINATYSGGVTQPTQHTRCRCGQRLIYQKEWDDTNHGANPYPVVTGITPK